MGSLGVADLAEDAGVKHIVRPTPFIVDESCNSNRAVLRRAFQVLQPRQQASKISGLRKTGNTDMTSRDLRGCCLSASAYASRILYLAFNARSRFQQAWRMHVAQQSTSARRARDSVHHLLPSGSSQVSGHIMSCSRAVDVSVESSLLHVAVEVGTLRRALLYCCELAEAAPQDAEPFCAPVPVSGKLSSAAGRHLSCFSCVVAFLKTKAACLSKLFQRLLGV